MRKLARLALLALPLLPALAHGQSVLPSFGIKVGYSQGDLPGLAGGLDFKLPASPIRLDADVWASFADFGKKSAGTAFTVNYLKQLPLVYVGAGLGYAYGVDKHRNHFDGVAGKIFVGGKIPFAGTGVEGALIFSDHVVGTISLVYRI